MTPLLKVSNLDIFFNNNQIKPDFHAVRHVSFTLNKGEILGIVGESGSGKSLTALSLPGLLPYPKAYHSASSSVKFKGEELIGKPDLKEIRGGKIGFVFQEPMSSLNPLHTIGKQIAETIMLHQGLNSRQARPKVLRLLRQTGIKNPRSRLNSYPHELSGGQRQRVMIAMAIANRPDILIADEPTTALDVTVQKQIIELLLKLRAELGMSMIFISHDLQLVRQIADRVIVMQRGTVIESGNIKDIFEHPCHEYTKTLIYRPNILTNKDKTSKGVVLSAHNITVRFPLQKTFWGSVKEYLYAVNNLSFQLQSGQTLGIVGESGSGKSTLGQALCGLLPFTGNVFLNSKSITDYSAKTLRRNLQIVFQDPYNSLNPRMNIEQIIGEGLSVHEPKLSAAEKRSKIIKTLRDVGLNSHILDKYPHEFSGGQRQRIAIARALILNPRIIILDEPTSALDATIQRQFIELMKFLQQKHDLSYIFISHDMNAVLSLSDHILVMKDGKAVEYGSAEQILSRAKQEYTRQLIGAARL